METTYYKYNDSGDTIRVQEFMSKKAHAAIERKKLKPFGDEAGQFSTEIGDEVRFQWIQHEDYIDDYGPPPKKKTQPKPVAKPICWEDYGPSEKQLLMEIRKENEREAKQRSKPIYKKKPEVQYDKRGVVILNTDQRVCEYDIYEVCKQYGNIQYIYNTNSKYNNIVFVYFYNEEDGINCCNSVSGMIYNMNILETQFMTY